MSQVILVVEDDVVIQDMVKAILASSGHEVLIAETGAEMYAVLAEKEVDLIMLDLGLPDGDALPHIMELRKQSDVPVIILTARQRIDDRLMALGLGADDYLTKLIDTRELKLRVENLLARSGGQARLPSSTPVPPTPRSAPPVAPANRSFGMILSIFVLIAGGSAGGYLYLSAIDKQQTDVPITVTAVATTETAPAMSAAPATESAPEPVSVPEPTPELAPPSPPAVQITEPAQPLPVAQAPEPDAISPAQ